METVPIKTNPSIRKQIDPATLRRLYHEEHMSTKAIAQLCGVCTATVLKYVGPVAKGRRPEVEPVTDAPPPPKKKTKPLPEQPKRLMRSKTELRGESALFEIDHDACALLVRGSTFELLMSREEVEVFIWELVEAYESIPKQSGDSSNIHNQDANAAVELPDK